MIRSLLPTPLPTGKLRDNLWVIRDGFVNFYVLRGPGGLVCVDAGWRAGHIHSAFERLGLDPANVVAVLLTHPHWDHTWGASTFPAAKRLAANCLPITDGEILEIAGLRVRPIACPGHTADSMAYLTEAGDLFTGDSLRLRAGKAHPNFSWLNRDNRTLCASLQRLAHLDGIRALFTGHTSFSLDAAFALREYCEERV